MISDPGYAEPRRRTNKKKVEEKKEKKEKKEEPEEEIDSIKHNRISTLMSAV